MRRFRYAPSALCGFAFACLTAAAASADAPYAFDRTPGRLPKNVVPINYAIDLRPNLAKRTTSGTESVTVRVRTATRTLVLNALDMTLSNATLTGAGTAAVASDPKAQTAKLSFARTVAPGVHVLHVAFSGKIGTEPQGLFVQPYTTAAGASEEMLATQFESTDARRMFPCWDEPAFRATYQLKVTVPRDFEAVSNTPIVASTTTAQSKTVSFARTPKMSSYLVVLSAGRFATISDRVDGVTVRVVAPHDRIEQGRYALDSATKLLAYYDTYFGVRFPLPKLDLIDVPGGFPGAMENWGGITFNETTLLFDPKIEPESSKQEIFATIAHEMSHQWTGDLVTMDWWSGLWLNESFADWMQTKATDHFNPAWHLWDRVESDVEGAMRTDQQSTTHPVEQPVEDDTQAAAAFDEITYQKGGAVIRMMEQYLGEDAFRDGVRAYLIKHAYSNATAADLWRSLGASTHRDVAALIDPWITTPGVPLVSVTADCANGRRALALAQRRFFVEPGMQSAQLWPIPIGIARGGATAYTLLSQRTASVDGGSCDSPFVVNASALGYYRVAPDPATDAVQSAHLAQLSVAERARYVGDSYALMLAGTTTPERLIGTLNHIDARDALTVWNSALRSLNGIADLQAGQPGQAAFDAYIVRRLSPVFARVGWDAQPGEDPQTESLRGNLIGALSAAGDRAVIAEGEARFARFAKDKGSLAPGLREPVLGIAGTYADAATWSALHAMFAASKNPVEARQYAMALWQARDPQLAAKNLQMAVSGEIPTQFGSELAFFDVLEVALGGRQPALAWSYFQAHQSEMTAKLSSFEQPLVIAAVAPLFWNAAPVAQLDALIDAARNLPAAQVARAKHAIDVRLAQRAAVLPAIDRALAQTRT